MKACHWIIQSQSLPHPFSLLNILCHNDDGDDDDEDAEDAEDADGDGDDEDADDDDDEEEGGDFISKVSSQLIFLK